MIRRINIALLTAACMLLMGSSMQRFFNGWAPDSSAQWTQASTGGDIVFAVNASAVSFKSLSGAAAAGSTIADCAAVSRVITTVTTVTAGQGFCLDTPTNSGVMRVIQNRGANDMKLYPPTAGTAINGGTNGAAITLTAAGKQIATCWHTGAGNWMVGVSTGP